MKKTTIAILCILASATTAMAQSINVNAILQSVIENNPQLKAARKNNEAEIAEKKAENVLGETAVEYTPFYQKHTNGLSSSELIVSQEFDFPTVYGFRRKSTNIRQEVLLQNYYILERDVCLEALNTCYDLSTAMKQSSLLKSRMTAADSLLIICNRRMAQGTTTIMELNRVKMDRMEIQTEVIENNGDIQRLRLQLLLMGASSSNINTITDTLATHIGNDEEVKLDTSAINADEVSLAVASLKSADHDVKMMHQEWLPKLTLGYRRNTEYGAFAHNGVLVGMSVPLFSNSSKIRAARIRQSAREQELDNVKMEVANRKATLQVEAITLSQLITTYDVSLMNSTLSTLMRAVAAGELSIADYYTEADKVYSTLQARLDAENKYRKIVAALWAQK